MCVDFTDINDACIRDPHHLTNIDCLIDESSGYKTLTFMDVDSRYNQIKMDPINAPNMTCMSNHANYYYNAIPFWFKNAEVTYQRLMDAVFSRK